MRSAILVQQGFFFNLCKRDSKLNEVAVLRERQYFKTLLKVVEKFCLPTNNNIARERGSYVVKWRVLTIRKP